MLNLIPVNSWMCDNYDTYDLTLRGLSDGTLVDTTYACRRLVLMCVATAKRPTTS